MDTNRPTAYSYTRFSTSEQAHGDSLRRQTEAAMAYAEAHGLNLDTDLTFRDSGVSAYREKNVNDGALGQFIAAADSGKIAPGSFLLVEDLDRLSRAEPLVAMNRLADLVGRGIRVVTLNDGQEHNAESLTRLDGLIVPLVKASLAHEESVKKSKRLRAAWKNKRERAANGEILTSWAPAWLRVSGGKFEVIERRAEVVRRIFDLTLKGVGLEAIAKKLNADKVPVFGKSNGWHHSYVSKILNNAAVVGAFQPKRTVFKDGKKRRVPDGPAIPDYFPAVIEESVFLRVKHSRPGPSGKGAAVPRNELSGLVFCAKCGGRMHYISKGPPPKGAAYLACDNARRKGECKAKSVRYETVVTHVLAHLTDYQKFREAGAPSAKDYSREIEGLAARIAKVEGTIARLLDTLERVPSASAEKRLAEHEASLGELTARKIEVTELAAIGNRGDDFEKMLNEAQWVDGIEPDELNLVFLHRVKEIRRVIERIEIEKDKPIRVTPRSSDIAAAQEALEPCDS